MMHRLITACAALATAAMAVAACTSGASSLANAPTATSTPAITPVSFPTAQLGYHTAAGDGVLRIEVASTPAQLERGLGYRDALAEDAGMLFDLHEARIQDFWMKGMRFALDFVWIGEDKRVAAVTSDVQAQPGASDAELRRYDSPVPVRYVLEVDAGQAARLGIAPGSELTFDLPSQ